MSAFTFSLFDQFADSCTVSYFGKHDAITSDQDAANRTGTQEYVSLEQVHGGTVITVNAQEERIHKADAAITSTSTLGLLIRAADCQNFALFDPVTKSIAVIHAGWKGLLSSIIPHCITQLETEFSVDPATLYVAAGPSLCMNCAEFTDPVTELPGIDPTFFLGRHVDLQGIADSQLLKAGIDPKKLQRHPDCTVCQSNKYYTYRGGDREEVLTGLSNYLVCQLL